MILEFVFRQNNKWNGNLSSKKFIKMKFFLRKNFLEEFYGQLEWPFLPPPGRPPACNCRAVSGADPTLANG